MNWEFLKEPFTGKLRNTILIRTLFMLMLMLTLSQCGFYKMNGVTIPPDVETVSIAYFDNRAGIVNPLLSQQFSEKLKTKFISETNLDLVASSGDFSFSGSITEYTVEPVAIQNNTSSSLNRLKITIMAKMECAKHPKLNFEQSFTQFQDFDANKSFSSLETKLVDDITNMIVQEIFNRAAINW